MDRFQILKGADPFAKKPQGDPYKFNLMGMTYKGWMIKTPPTFEETSIILEVSENQQKFLPTLKTVNIEIEFKDKFEIFEGTWIKNSPYKQASKQKGKVRAHFTGRIVKVRTANYIIGKA
jgi:hypothetical protein